MYDLLRFLHWNDISCRQYAITGGFGLLLFSGLWEDFCSRLRFFKRVSYMNEWVAFLLLLFMSLVSEIILSSSIRGMRICCFSFCIISYSGT